jgi:type III pantothenate kinase
MILTIDAGNTRTKWATFNDVNAIIAHGTLNNAELIFGAEQWAGCDFAVISNVAGDAMAEKLKAILPPAVRQHWVIAAESGFGIKNRYEQPERLGCDRWAAMVGARQYTGQSCLVVNAGTALTIDALLRESATNSHVFSGGVIIPGWHLMQQALLQGTQGIQPALTENKAGSYVGLPIKTEDAIYTGALLAMTGAIEHMSMHLQRQADEAIHCMLGGGDAHLLAERLADSAVISDIVVIEDMVLRGLLVIGREIK